MHDRLPTLLFHVFSSLICVLLICGVLLSPSSRAVTEDLKIPNLGESSTSLFSADYEYQLGRMWLRSFRGQAPLLNDPLMHSYLERTRNNRGYWYDCVVDISICVFVFLSLV